MQAEDEKQVPLPAEPSMMDAALDAPVLSADDDLNRRLVGSFPGGVVQVAMDGSIVQANQEAQRILGLGYDDLKRRYVADFRMETVWEDGTPCEPEDYPVSKCLRTGQPQPGVTIGVRRPDGHFCWALFTATPILDPVSRKPAGAIVRFIDFTERKQSELRLRELKEELERRVDERTVLLQAANEELKKEIAERQLVEARLRESKRFAEGLAQAIPYIMYVYDLQKREAVFTNEHALRTLGYTQEELKRIGPGVAEKVLHPDWHAPLEQHLERISQAADGEVVEFEYVAQRPDGQTRWVRTRDVVFSRGPEGQVRQIIGTAEDITDYKHAVAAEQETSSRLQFITEHAPDFILQIDRQGIILFINRTLPPNTPESVVGTSFRNWIPEADAERFLQLLDNVFTQASSEHIEITSVGPHGATAWYACHMGPVREAGQIRSAVVVARDITERKRADERLRAKQQLLKSLLALQERERKLVAAEIHDGLVQDITGAKMLLEGAQHQLEAGFDDPLKSLSRVEELLGRAIHEGRRMIGDLRPLLTDDQGLVEMIHFLVQEESRRTGREIHFTPDVAFDRLDPLLEGTVFRITQEALTNVRKHSRARHVDIRLLETDQWLLLEIDDDGVGFDPDRVGEDRYGIQGIFHRARLFGGTATIDSRPGAGARIRVELPLSLTATMESS